jgi:AcrR family transcriptional regulator
MVINITGARKQEIMTLKSGNHGVTRNAAGPTRRRRRKEARPGEIVAAALKEFAAKGFAAARLEDVAASAGISKGTIYLYYPTKEALFEAVVREMITPILNRAEAAQAERAMTCEQLLRVLIETLYRQLVATERRQILRMLIADAPRFPDLVSLYHREAVARGRVLLRTIVDRGVATGEFRQGPASRFPEAILGPAIMLAIWKMLFEPLDPLDLDQFMDAHIDLVLHGLLRE